jgi:hypothetical protein
MEAFGLPWNKVYWLAGLERWPRDLGAVNLDDASSQKSAWVPVTDIKVAGIPITMPTLSAHGFPR